MSKLRVLLDSHQTPFSERYKALLIAHNVEVEDFDIPQNHPESYQAYIRHIGQSPAKNIHFLWGYNHWSALLIPRLLGKKVILHWIGSDVVQALQHPGIPWKLLGSTHLVMDAQQSVELSKLHISSTVVRAPCNFSDSLTPWPSENAVLTYLPENADNLYGQNEVLQLAQQLPRIIFFVVGNNQNISPLDNVRHRGWVSEQEMNELYALCKVVLRLTRHDAGASMAMEALARNRYVLWTKPYPYCELVSLSNLEHIKRLLLACLSETEPNIGAREYVLQDFDQEKIAQQLIKIYKGEKV